MMPILFPHDQTKFDSNGIGVLSDAVAGWVQREVNGLYDLELQYPQQGIHFDQLAHRSIIYSKASPYSEYQPFRVYKITRSSSGIATVLAHHAAYDLAGVPVAPFSATGAPAALAGLKANAVIDNPFTFSTDKTASGTFTVASPAAIWSLLGGTSGSILDVFGGEYDYDHFHIKLLSRLGIDRGVRISYGKNLTSLQQDENCASCYTGILPFWTNRSTGEVVMLPERTIAAEGDFGYVRILPVDLTQKFSSVAETSEEALKAPTEDQLRAAGKQYIKDNDIGIPDVSLNVQFSNSSGELAELDRIELGDSVEVDFVKMKISTTARAVGYTYNILQDRYENVSIGKVRASLADKIVSQDKEIATLPDKSQMAFAMEQLANTIMGASGGSVRFLDTNGDKMPDTLYVADDPDPAVAKKVWRINYEGWAASKNGYNGPFVMGATFEDGILGEFMRAGTLDANLVKVINLIAEALYAIGDNGDYVNIANGEIIAGNTAEQRESFALRRNGSKFSLQFLSTVDSSQSDQVYSEFSWNGLNLGGISKDDAAFAIQAERYNPNSPGFVKIQLPGETVKSLNLYTYWKRNNDGTYSMVGTTTWQE